MGLIAVVLYELKIYTRIYENRREEQGNAVKRHATCPQSFKPDQRSAVSRTFPKRKGTTHATQDDASSPRLKGHPIFLVSSYIDAARG